MVVCILYVWWFVYRKEIREKGIDEEKGAKTEEK
jgi:cbb3-type cytochrome oxidase subunit 3